MKAAPADVDMDELFAGAEDWDLDDYVPSPRKPSPRKPARQSQAPQHGLEKVAYQPEPYTRCVVDAVSEIELEGRWLKQLDAHIDKQAKDSRIIYLQDDWYDTDVRPGDIVNAIGHFDTLTPHRKPSIKITAQTNLLILHPDILLTATALSNAPQCARKPLLSSLVRASNDITPALVWGNMLHEVMQSCLVEKRWDEAWINERIDEVLINGLGMLLALNVSVETARTELRRRAVGLGIFKDRYIADVPRPEAVLSDTRSRSNDSEMLLAIPQLHEIEEDIWSPKYGLKGKVDATVEAVVAEKPASKNAVMNNYFSKKPAVTSSSSATSTLTSGPRPFEIKTGRSLAGLEHRAQTMLYTLLTSERYGVDVPDGLLYYTQTDTVVRVPRSRNELRGLIVARNELAGYMIKRIGREGDHKRRGGGEREREENQQDIEEVGMHAEPFLPRPIDNEHACRKCFTIDTCMLYRYAYSATPSSPSPSKSLSTTPPTKRQLPQLESPPIPGDSVYDTYQLKTGHLTAEQGLFFRQWETLLSLEERDLVRFRRELWTLGAEERERKGRCFAGMVLVKDKLLEDDAEEEGVEEEVDVDAVPPVTDGKVYKFSYTFVKSKAFAAPSSSRSSDDGSEARSLLNGHLNVGDPVTLSVEPHLLAFAQGYITHLTPDKVRLGVDHPVDLARIRARLQKDVVIEDNDDGEADEEVIFRIDKDELFGGMGRMRNNLAQLFYANGDTKRLGLVVDLRKPVFSSDAPAPTSSLTPPMLDSPHAAHLNDSQKQAIEKVLTAEDYALILGMPGTGKTTVIAALIKILVDQGKTVLLTSYTHSAVDTILRKLSEDEDDASAGGSDPRTKERKGLGFGVLRLGNVEKVHPDVRKYTLGARKKATSVEQLEIQWMSPPVVASTCLSVDHPLFNRRKFDFCIVDEASQITLPTCLGPLRYADKFILVGDHFQLPPLVKNPLARRGGLDVSLFRRLSDAHPESVIDLREQYRMNEDIMLLSNKLIYSDRLKCGSEEVAKRRLILPLAPSDKAAKGDWLDAVHRLRQKRSNKAPRVSFCPGIDNPGLCWLSHLASPDTTAVFVDTDSLGTSVARDSRVGDLVQNEVEAELVTQFVQALTGKWGVKKRDVGVISLYRQQVKLIKSMLSDGRQGQEQHVGLEERGKTGGEDGGEVEVLTADKSQGRDKECIVVSMVRSNDEGKIGDLVKDWRRMNVSFTRARSKLVIFGSRKTLKGDALLGQFFELMEGRGWVYELPPNAHLVHRRDLDSRWKPSTEEAEDSGIEVLDEEEVNVPEQTFPEELTMCAEVQEDTAADIDLTLVEMKTADVKEDALKWADHVGNQDDDDDVELVDVKESSSKVVSGNRGQDDDEDVEIVDEFYIAPQPKSASSKKHYESANHRAKPTKKRKAEPMVIDIEEDEVEGKGVDMMANSKTVGSLSGKRKGASSKQTEASSAVSAASAAPSKTVSKSTSNGSLKRSRPSGKENTSGKGSGPLDKFFLVAKGSGTKTGPTADDGNGKSERPTKKVKAEPPVSRKKELTKPAGRKAPQKDIDRKASGLVKGRPILKDLVESEY
ncbi:hypothetical protein MD484_g2295, partial [Candolleomyces efflorescens]